MKTVRHFLFVLCSLLFQSPSHSAPGDVDTSFNKNLNGFVYKLLAQPDVMAQPDGKMVIAGSFTTVDGVARLGFARLNSDGTLDTTFNVSSVPNGTSSSFVGPLQPDGKIFLRFIPVPTGDQTHTGIARLNSDGTLDTSFDPASNVVYGSAVAMVT